MVRSAITDGRSFDLYRYQLLPLSRNVQFDLTDAPLTVEQLRERKNSIFAEILNNLPSIRHRNKDVIHRLDMHEGDWFVFHLAPKKTITRSRPDFDVEHLDDWPNVIVVVNNAPDVQGLAISRNAKAFSSPNVVAQMLVEHLQPILEKRHLHIEIEALFESKTFWSLVDQYRGRITSVTFELVSPNMANISKVLEIDLARLNSETNSHRTDLTLNSADGSALEIQKDHTIVDSLVAYASQGGGDIVIHVKGLHRSIRTSKSVKDVSIDEMVLDNPTPETLAVLKDIFK